MDNGDVHQQPVARETAPPEADVNDAVAPLLAVPASDSSTSAAPPGEDVDHANSSSGDESDNGDGEGEEEDAAATTNNSSTNNNRHVGGAIGVANQLGSNILQACSCLATAVREYYSMPQSDQLQVWDDLTGYQGQKRVFVQGKELPGYREEYEPKAMVEEALKKLPLELQRMPSSHKHDAFDKALEMAPDYVNARAFQLKFLRAEKFDVFAAAIRMCRHFEVKSELFGPESLGREITLEDLDPDDMAAFETGYVQVLQATDQGHRPVIFYYKAVSSECYKNRENILRAFWYMANRLSDAEEVQKLGVSNVVYNNGGFPRQGMDYEKSRRFAYIFRSIPVRYNNFYVCLDDSPWLNVVETFAVMITRFLRVRLRMMRGTHKQVVEKLEAVGVPAKALPVNDKSELLVDAHIQWIQKQREREEKLRQKEQAGDLVAKADKAPFQMDQLYQMDTLANLAAMTSSFYGEGAAGAFSAGSFHTVG